MTLDELLAAAGIGRDDPNGYMPPDLDPMAYMPRPSLPMPQPVEAPPMQLPGAGGGGFAENFGLALAQSPLAYRSRGRGGAEDFIGNLLASAGNTYAGATARGVQQREGFNERQRIAMADRNRSNIAASRLAEREKIERLQKVSDSARTLRERRSEKEADRIARLEDEKALIRERARYQQNDGPGQMDRPIRPGSLSPRQLQGLGSITDNVRMDPDVKDFVVIRDNYKRIKSAANSGTGIGDLSLIFSYMRVLDPTSVVRESEYRNAAEAIGKLPVLATTPRNWVAGDKLTPQGRQGFIDAARQIYDSKLVDHKRAVNMYRMQAEAYGIDPNLILRDYGITETVTMRTADGRTKEVPADKVAEAEKRGAVRVQ